MVSNYPLAPVGGGRPNCSTNLVCFLPIFVIPEFRGVLGPWCVQSARESEFTQIKGNLPKKYPLATVGVRCQTCSTNLALFLTFFGSVLPSSLSPLGAQSARVSEATEILKQLSKNTRSLLWRSGPHGVPKALENLMPLKI